MKNSFFTIKGHTDFLKHILIDYKLKDPYYFQVKAVKFLPLYLDRLIEVLVNYPIKLSAFISICRKYDFPMTDFFKEKFIGEFSDNSPSGLYQSYLDSDLLYILRLMLAYNRVDFIRPFWPFIKKHFKNGRKKVLDYGSGVSDIGIFLARKGSNVTLVELDTPKADFAKKRFNNRKLECNLIKVKDTESLPVINNKFDFIIATEIVEHYRHPIELINFFHSLLKNDGLLLNNMGLEFDRERGADHLDEALAEGNSKAYWENYWRKFQKINLKNLEPWLFKKRG